MPKARLPAIRMTRLPLVVALAAVALSASPAAAGSTVTVDVRTVSYSPSDLTVDRGTPVTWSNTVSPSRVHDVVSSIEDYFDSDRFGQGQSWSYRFDAAGTFHYLCTIHDTMLGTVHVALTGKVLDTPTGPIMRVRLAARPLAESSPFRYVVLRRDPGNTLWTPWRVTTAAVAEFRPDVPGTYDFVMRIRNTTSGRNTGRAGDSPILHLEWAG